MSNPLSIYCARYLAPSHLGQHILAMAREVLRGWGARPLRSLAQEACAYGPSRGVMPCSGASFAAVSCTRAAWHASDTRWGAYGRRYPRSHASRKDTPRVRAPAIPGGAHRGNRTSVWVHGAARPRWAPGAISYASGSMVVPDG